MRTLAFSLSLLLAVGCGTIQTYEGPKRAAQEVAVLKTVVLEMSMDSALIAHVDGKDVSMYSEVEVLPGRHTVRLIVSTGMFKAGRTVLFETKAGRSYRAKGMIRRGNAFAWIEDEGNGDFVAGEKP